MDVGMNMDFFGGNVASLMAWLRRPDGQDPQQHMGVFGGWTTGFTGILHQNSPNDHTNPPFCLPGSTNPLVYQSTAQSVTLAGPVASGPSNPALAQYASQGMEYVINISDSLAGQVHSSLGPSSQYGANIVLGSSQNFVLAAAHQQTWGQLPLQQAQQPEPQHGSGIFGSFSQPSGNTSFQNGGIALPGPSQGLTASAQPQGQSVPAVPQAAHQLGPAQGAYTVPASSNSQPAAQQPPQLGFGRSYELDIVEQPLGGRICGLEETPSRYVHAAVLMVKVFDAKGPVSPRDVDLTEVYVHIDVLDVDYVACGYLHVPGRKINKQAIFTAERASGPQDGKYETFENLVVKQALVPRVLSDNGQDGLFVLASDVSIRAPGAYRCGFTLMVKPGNGAQPQRLSDTVFSDPFDTFNARKGEKKPSRGPLGQSLFDQISKANRAAQRRARNRASSDSGKLSQ